MIADNVLAFCCHEVARCHFGRTRCAHCSAHGYLHLKMFSSCIQNRALYNSWWRECHVKDTTGRNCCRWTHDKDGHLVSLVSDHSIPAMSYHQAHSKGVSNAFLGEQGAAQGRQPQALPLDGRRGWAARAPGDGRRIQGRAVRRAQAALGPGRRRAGPVERRRPHRAAPLQHFGALGWCSSPLLPIPVLWNCTLRWDL